MQLTAPVLAESHSQSTQGRSPFDTCELPYQGQQAGFRVFRETLQSTAVAVRAEYAGLQTHNSMERSGFIVTAIQ